jgi:hypothetical protein
LAPVRLGKRKTGYTRLLSRVLCLDALEQMGMLPMRA